jgi:hypothetical protein
MKQLPQFSFFRAPVTQNKAPHANTDLSKLHKVITGDYHTQITNELRSITKKEENRKYKARWFNYVTFSGIFQKRGEQYLIEKSGLLVLDFDNLPDVVQTKNKLLTDPYFETQLLFVSPNGTGLKWVIEIDISGKYTHGEMFDAISNYIKSTYSIEVDKSGRDISRVCFISYDLEAFIHPKYLINETTI